MNMSDPLPKLGFSKTSRITGVLSNGIALSRHSPDKLDCQSEVSYTARPVSFHQYVLTLQIPVSDGGFSLGAEDLGVEVTEARHGGVSQPQHGFIVQSGWFEVVVQGAILMVVGDQVELGPGAGSFNISSNKTWGRSGRRIKSVTDEELHSSFSPNVQGGHYIHLMSPSTCVLWSVTVRINPIMYVEQTGFYWSVSSLQSVLKGPIFRKLYCSTDSPHLTCLSCWQLPDLLELMTIKIKDPGAQFKTKRSIDCGSSSSSSSIMHGSIQPVF